MKKENIFEEVALEAKDVKALKDHLLVTFIVFGIIGAIISGVIALLGPLSPDRSGEFNIPQTGADYMSEVLIIFVVGMSIFLLLALWVGWKIYLDLSRRRKLRSRTIIAKKYVHKGTNYFEFGTQPIKKLAIKHSLFDSFSEGETVDIEYSKFNEYILKLEKA